MFEFLQEMQFDPLAAAGGILGGILGVVVMSQTEFGLIYKMGAFIGSAVVCYFMVGRIFNKG